MSQWTVRFAVVVGLIGLGFGCGAPKEPSGKMFLPADARMLAYGRYIPATYVPDEPGLLYYVDAGTGQVVHVMSAATRRHDGPLSAEQLPDSMKASFDANKQYRVYFVPQSNTPTNPNQSR
ncbi:MAG TPA: hypothetical protein VF669_01065 [Tepidisphaeraceae bacterium]|jgi:hypothetical protein